MPSKNKKENKMKKLMVMLGAVAFAAGVQAASINWSAANISSGNGVVWNGGKADTKGSGYAAYFFLTASTAAADASILVTREDVVSKLTSGDNSILAKAANLTGEKHDVPTYTTTAGGISTTAIGSYGVTQNDSFTAFMVVFDNADPTKAGYVAISDTKSGELAKGATTGKALGWTNYTASNAWTAINAPEPTSGLLMLLGMAGLALRRRRA